MSVDLQDIFLHITVHMAHRKYLRFLVGKSQHKGASLQTLCGFERIHQVVGGCDNSSKERRNSDLLSYLEFC